MNFLFPVDDIIDDIDKNHESLSMNKALVSVAYQETQWNNSAPIKQMAFNDFKSLLTSDDNITLDNIVSIKYINIFLWHKTDKMDRIYGSGDTQKTEKWDQIKHQYASYIKLINHDHNKDKDDEKGAMAKKTLNITLNVEKEPQAILGHHIQNRRYRYYWNDPSDDIINNGFYEITNNNNNRNTKINIEKILKKSFKKTKLYHENSTFKFLTPTQIDSVYRNYENMEINIINESTLNTIYRMHSGNGKTFKKLCILNTHCQYNGLHRNSTLSHSLNRYDYDISSDKTDQASLSLYSNTMVYSPNVVIFNDINGDLMVNYVKLSVITAYPVNVNEYYRIKRTIFEEPLVADRLKALEDKLNANMCSSKKHRQHRNNNKSKKRTEEETMEFMAKMEEMKDNIEGIMRERIRRMIEIAIYNGCDAVIFDAFGCNENCGNDVLQIAKIFAQFIKTVYFNCFKSVTFTILEHDNRNQRKVNHKQDKESMQSKFSVFHKVFQDSFS